MKGGEVKYEHEYMNRDSAECNSCSEILSGFEYCARAWRKAGKSRYMYIETVTSVYIERSQLDKPAIWRAPQISLPVLLIA